MRTHKHAKEIGSTLYYHVTCKNNNNINNNKKVQRSKKKEQQLPFRSKNKKGVQRTETKSPKNSKEESV